MSAFGPACWRCPDQVDLRAFARPAWPQPGGGSQFRRELSSHLTGLPGQVLGPRSLRSWRSARCWGRCQQGVSQMTTTPGFPVSARPTGGRRKQRTTVMRTRRNLVSGIAAAVLGLAACGMAGGCSGGTPAGHAAAVSAGHAPAGTWVTGQGDIAGSSGTSCGAGSPPGRSGRRRARQGSPISRPWPRSSGMWCCAPGGRPGAGKRPRGACRGTGGRGIRRGRVLRSRV